VGSVPTRVADHQAAGTRQALRRDTKSTKLFRFNALWLAERVGFGPDEIASVNTLQQF
jgi:hypothetical protein